MSGKISKFIDLYVKLCAIVALMVATKIINIWPSPRARFVRVISYTDLEQLSSKIKDIDSLTWGKIESIRNLVAPGIKYVAVGAPSNCLANHECILPMYDGSRIWGNISPGRGSDFRFLLGITDTLEYPTCMGENLATRSDSEKVAGAFFGYHIATQWLSSVIWLKDTIQDIFRNVKDSTIRDQLFLNLWLNREFISILSIENSSGQSITDINVNLNVAPAQGIVKFCAWTYSVDDCFADTSIRWMKPKRITVKNLRPNHSIEAVIRSRYHFRDADISLNWNRSETINKKSIIIILGLLTLITFLILWLDTKSILSKRKSQDRTISQKPNNICNNSDD